MFSKINWLSNICLLSTDCIIMLLFPLENKTSFMIPFIMKILSVNLIPFLPPILHSDIFSTMSSDFLLHIRRMKIFLRTLTLKIPLSFDNFCLLPFFGIVVTIAFSWYLGWSVHSYKYSSSSIKKFSSFPQHSQIWIFPSWSLAILLFKLQILFKFFFTEGCKFVLFTVIQYQAKNIISFSIPL